MTETNVILIKSEKVSQKMKKLIAWAVAAALVIVMFTTFAIDYKGYKEGQEFGLALATVTSEISNLGWIDPNDSYEQQCRDAFYKLDGYTPDFYYNGIRYDASDIRKSESEMKDAFRDLMVAGGYDRYGAYNIGDWFKYTDMTEYFTEYYWKKPLPVCSYVVVFLALVVTLFICIEEKKELIVYEESVLCKVNKKKAKQLVFKDINSVDFGSNSIKIAGTGIRFKILNLTNAEAIKSVIIEKKNAAQSKPEVTNVSGAEELMKFKELLDRGIITQEEFNAKKNQILGL